MKNSLRIHKWTHNEFNIFILGVLTHPLFFCGDLQLAAPDTKQNVALCLDIQDWIICLGAYTA